jgi:D-alanyl-lipoteichoic acid acyltransferase DltB (MBOAT superfamily)
MVFHSAAFVIFLFLVAFAFLIFRRAPWVLLAASYAFYLTLSPGYAVLLAAATGIAFAAGLAIDRATSEQRKVQILTASVVGFLLLLAFFKYRFLRPVSGLELILPVGMSYYLFKIIGYLVDVYWQRIPAERSLVAFATYVAFFPQIVAGPIQRPADFLTQLRARRVTPELFVSGLRRLLFGGFCKLVVADRLAQVVIPVFDAPTSRSPLELTMAVYLFALQLYADFSAATSIAIGAGRLLGISGPENFDAPYLSPSLPEFWRRWHMSLTSWLTDYVYSPLRHRLRNLGDAGMVVAIMANMIAVGVWHGERASYLVFGLVNGVFMSVAALTLRARKRFFRARPHLERLRRYWGVLITFHVVAGSFVFFRASSLAEAWGILRRIGAGALALFAHPSLASGAAVASAARGLGFIPVVDAALVCGLPVMFLGHHLIRHQRASAYFLRAPTVLRWATYYAMVAIILVLGRFELDTFIYAQF